MHTLKADHRQAARDQQRRVRRGRHVFGVLTMLLALAGVVWMTRSLDNSYAGVQAAWAARPFTAYRASIAHHYEIGELLRAKHSCVMTVEVHPNVEPVLLTGNCPEPLSIEAILARFEPYAIRPVAWRTCELADCTCQMSVLTVERDPRTGYLRRIARDWRDATINAWPVWWLQLPTPLRATLRALAERWNSCPIGVGNSTFDPSRYIREEFRIISMEPL
jgi:hypothetical protein